MKSKLIKAIIVFLALIILGSVLISCGYTSTSTPSSSNRNKTKTEETKKEATTTKAPETTAAPEPEKEAWEKKFYVDDFQQPTSEWFLVTEIYDGKFSNSATTNSQLAVAVTIDDDHLCFILYEYGSHQVKNIHSKAEYYTVSVRDSFGNTYDYNGYIPSSADRITFDYSTASSIINLMSSGDVSVYIKENDTPTSTYLFTIPSDNLSSLLIGTGW